MRNMITEHSVPPSLVRHASQLGLTRSSFARRRSLLPRPVAWRCPSPRRRRHLAAEVIEVPRVPPWGVANGGPLPDAMRTVYRILYASALGGRRCDESSQALCADSDLAEEAMEAACARGPPGGSGAAS